MESNKSYNREEICHFGKKKCKSVLLGYSLFKKTSLPIFHSNSFGLSLISLVFKNFFLIISILIVVFPFRTGKRRTYFQKH